jgi:membrane protein DedA with SNARE-associated domain
MPEPMIERVIHTLAAPSPTLVYLFIAAGAAVENVVPPIPADTFVLLGAVLAAAGRAEPRYVFLWTWLANVGGAMAVYLLARRYGNRFFNTAVGHWLLHPRQLEQVGRFYQRWGWPAIFVSRFLPGLRAVVPVFAGVTEVPVVLVVVPVAVASALWYGFIVYLGAFAGNNLDVILAQLDRVGNVLLAVATVVVAAIAHWWWRSRRG